MEGVNHNSKKMKVLGVEWAPLGIPLARRLQTLVIMYWIMTFLFAPVVGMILFISMFFYSYLRMIALLYIAWRVYDRNIYLAGGRRSDWVRRWKMWEYMRDYFPVKLVKTVDLDPTKNYVMGYHPHGVFSAGAFTNFATEATGWSKTFPGITPSLLTLDGNFRTPFHREFLLASGVCGVSRESCEYILSKKGVGNAMCIVIGGAAESLDARPGVVTLTLRRRKGFVRQAIKHGASLLPVFSFGENELFNQMENPAGSKLRSFQDYFTKMIGFAPPMIYGRGVFQYNFGFMPFRKPVMTVIGRPIEVEKKANATQEEVDKIHEQYINSLVELFNEHKASYGKPYDTIEIKIA